MMKKTNVLLLEASLILLSVSRVLMAISSDLRKALDVASLSIFESNFSMANSITELPMVEFMFNIDVISS